MKWLFSFEWIKYRTYFQFANFFTVLWYSFLIWIKPELFQGLLNFVFFPLYIYISHPTPNGTLFSRRPLFSIFCWIVEFDTGFWSQKEFQSRSALEDSKARKEAHFLNTVIFRNLWFFSFATDFFMFYFFQCSLQI